MTTIMEMFWSLMATMMMTNEDERWENLVRIVSIPLLFLLLLLVEAKSGNESVFRTQRRPEVVIAGMKWDCPRLSSGKGVKEKEVHIGRSTVLQRQEGKLKK